MERQRFDEQLVELRVVLVERRGERRGVEHRPHTREWHGRPASIGWLAGGDAGCHFEAAERACVRGQQLECGEGREEFSSVVTAELVDHCLQIGPWQPHGWKLAPGRASAP